MQVCERRNLRICEEGFDYLAFVLELHKYTVLPSRSNLSTRRRLEVCLTTEVYQIAMSLAKNRETVLSRMQLQLVVISFFVSSSISRTPPRSRS